jgi:hypothetical protein
VGFLKADNLHVSQFKDRVLVCSRYNEEQEIIFEIQGSVKSDQELVNWIKSCKEKYLSKSPLGLEFSISN